MEFKELLRLIGKEKAEATKDNARGPAGIEGTDQNINTEDCSIAPKLGNSVLEPIVSRVRTDRTAIKKPDGSTCWTTDALTPEHLAQHLNGGTPRGCCPIKAGDSFTRLALLDLDSHKGETPWHGMQRVAVGIMEELKSKGMQPIAFRSTGGRGIHIFLLWDTPQDAYSVRYFLNKVLEERWYQNGTGGVAKGEIEVFPKQDSVPVDGCGNMFILPLAGKSVVLDPSLNPVSKTLASLIFWPVSPPVLFVQKPVRAPAIQPTAADAQLACRALMAIPNDMDRDKWFLLLCSFKEAAGDEGESVALEWSAAHSSHDEVKFYKTWNSIKVGKQNGASSRYLFDIAETHGFKEHVLGEFDVFHAAEESNEQHFAFFAYLPAHQYLHRPTRAFWPAASVDGHLPNKIGKKKVSQWLDQYRAVQQATWHPAHGELLKDVVVADGGFVPRPGALVYNRYRPPVIVPSDVHPGPWLNHLRSIYPGEAAHLIKWFAHRIQYPGEKINHALVLGGSQGIGKDTILEPVRRGVGPWNWADIDPKKLTGTFNPFVESVVLRINEARDLGDLDRFAFYDHSKTYIAAPPDVLMCNNKHAKEYPVFNVMGVILTTNHKTNGIYLPVDDRRHYVAWSEAHKEDFDDQHWRDLWHWLNAGGDAAVVGYLRGVDLSDFNPKAPPPKTDAFFAIVQANANPDDVALSGITTCDDGAKLPVVTLDTLAAAAMDAEDNDLFNALTDSKNRRRVPHMMERAGYVPVRNLDAKDGLWKIGGRRQVVYADSALSIAERVKLTQAHVGAGR